MAYSASSLICSIQLELALGSEHPQPPPPPPPKKKDADNLIDATSHSFQSLSLIRFLIQGSNRHTNGSDTSHMEQSF